MLILSIKLHIINILQALYVNKYGLGQAKQPLRNIFLDAEFPYAKEALGKLHSEDEIIF
ncbi:MAG: hypothetical protein IPO27_06700 [Bacteroidetes bacterium]|nr:hypothetical protein [Bacteroidota bacterium]